MSNKSKELSEAEIYRERMNVEVEKGKGKGDLSRSLGSVWPTNQSNIPENKHLKKHIEQLEHQQQSLRIQFAIITN